MESLIDELDHHFTTNVLMCASKLQSFTKEAEEQPLMIFTCNTFGEELLQCLKGSQ